MKKILLLLIFVAGMFSYQLYRWVVNPGNLNETLNVVISRGVGVQSVARQLQEKGVIDKPWLFVLAARLQGLDKKLKAGEYQFEAGFSMQKVLQKIAAGEIFYHKLTLPEGLTTFEMLEIIRNEPALSGSLSVMPKEGEMLPETYSFLLGDTKDSIVLRAREAMMKAKDEVWAQRAAGLPIETADEMMVLASIIEKETSIASERGLVASVFINRLKKGMRLQTDPTVIYSLTLGQKEMERPLTRNDLSIDSPYNTYRYYGLPPSPICNPGKDAITAAVNPELSDYLYFVANGKGGHNFAVTLQEHNHNVQSYRQKR